MAVVDVEFIATANFSALIAQANAANIALARLQATTAAGGAEKMAMAFSQFTGSLTNSGRFVSQMVTVQNSTNAFGKSLMAGKLTLAEYKRELAAYVMQREGMIDKLAAQNVRMAQSTVISRGINPATGQMMAQVITSQGALASTAANQAALATQRMAVLNKMLIQGSHSLINWGKNTQWAGRQMMVGLSMPLLVIGGLAAKVFFDFDKELTRMVKVYGNGLSELTKQQADAMKEQARQTSFELAKMYGTPIKQTAELFGTIAQAGYEGADLVKNVELTTQLATLGSVDSQQAWQSVLTLQNAFRISTDDLQGSLDFLNATENSTVLSLQDVTAAIPRAAPAVRALGGDIKDLAAYLVAMREGGVPAAEAANAIKSSMASLINPTKRTREVLNGFGIDLKQIVRKNAGDLTGTILAVQAAFDKLDPLQRTQSIAQAFGKFQFSKITALLNNLGKEGSQTTKVFELMNFSVGELAVLREREITRLQNTASGKFKRAWGQITTDLAKFGEKFLNTATEVVKVVGKLIGFFDRLPKGVKGFLASLTLFAAFVGPIVMLTGVLANFVAYIGMGLVRLKALASGSKGTWSMMTPEMVAAEKASEIFDTAIMKQTDNIAVLTGAIGQLITRLTELAGASKAAGAAITAPLAMPVNNAVAAQVAALAQARALSAQTTGGVATKSQAGVYGHTVPKEKIQQAGGLTAQGKPAGAILGQGVWQSAAHNSLLGANNMPIGGMTTSPIASGKTAAGIPAAILAEHRAANATYYQMRNTELKMSTIQYELFLKEMEVSDGSTQSKVAAIQRATGWDHAKSNAFRVEFLRLTAQNAAIEFAKMEQFMAMSVPKQKAEIATITASAKERFMLNTGFTEKMWATYLNTVTQAAQSASTSVKEQNAQIATTLATYQTKFKAGLIAANGSIAEGASVAGSRILAFLETGAIGIAEYSSILARTNGGILPLLKEEVVMLNNISAKIIADTAAQASALGIAETDLVIMLQEVGSSLNLDLIKKTELLNKLKGQILAQATTSLMPILQPGGKGTPMTSYSQLPRTEQAAFKAELERLIVELARTDTSLLAVVEALGLDIEALALNTASNEGETASNNTSKRTTDLNTVETADNTAITAKLDGDVARLTTVEEIALMRGGAGVGGGVGVVPGGAGRVGGGMGMMGVGMGLTMGSMMVKGPAQHTMMTAGMLAMMLPMLLQIPMLAKVSQLVGSTGVLGKAALMSGTAARVERAALKTGLPAGIAAQKGAAVASAKMAAGGAPVAMAGAATPIGIAALAIVGTVVALKGIQAAMNNATKATNSYVGASNKLVTMLEGTTAKKEFKVTRREGDVVSESKGGVQSAKNVLSQLPEGDKIKDVIKDIQSGEDKYGFWGPMKRLLNFKREMNAEMSIPIKMQTIYANLINSGVEEQKARDYIQAILEEAGQEKYSAKVQIELSKVDVTNPEAMYEAILTNPLTKANKDFADALKEGQPEFTAKSAELSNFFRENSSAINNQIKDYYANQGYGGTELSDMVDETLSGIKYDVENKKPIDLSAFFGGVEEDSPLAMLADQASVVSEKFVELSDKVTLLHGEDFNAYVEGVANYMTTLQAAEGTDGYQKQHDALVNNIPLIQQYQDDQATFQEVLLKDLGLSDEKYKDVLATAKELPDFIDAATLAAHGIAPEFIAAAIAAGSLPESINIVVKMDIAIDAAIAKVKKGVNFDKMVAHTGGSKSGSGGDPYSGQKDANQKVIDSEKKIISQIEKKREAEKKAFDEKKRQNDYLKNQADSQIKYREALASGDFGAAAMAKNQMIADQNNKSLEDEQNAKDAAYQKQIDKHQGIIDRQEEINKGLDKLSAKAAQASQDIIDTHDDNVRTAESMWDKTVEDSRGKYYLNATEMQKDNKKTNDKLIELGIDQKSYWESAYRANKAGLSAEITAAGVLVEKATAEIQRAQLNIAQVADLAVWITAESKDGYPPTSEEISKKILKLAWHAPMLPIAAHDGGPIHGGTHQGGSVYGGMQSNRMGRSLRGPISSDEMLILAQDGEYMINASAAGIIGRKNLDAINNGKLPVAAIGGNSGSNYSFTVNAAPGQDARQIAQEVQRIFQINERRKGGARI